MARNPELEAAIAADPEAEGPSIVYSDWLQAQGDPRGELIAVQLALEDERGPRWADLKERERELLREHAGALLGPAAAWPHEWYDWRRGFVDRITVRLDPDGVDAVMAHPSLALVRAVAGARWATLQRARLPGLRELAIAHDAISDLLAMPGLRVARFARIVRVASPHAALPAHSALRSLAIAGLDPAALAGCACPALDRVRTAWRGDDAHFAAELAFVTATPRAELDLTLDEDTPIAALVADPAGARRVARLRLDYVPADRLRALQHRLPGVRGLDLIGDRSGPALALADVAALPAERLVELRISRALTAVGVVAALVALPCATTLESLAIELHDQRLFAALCRGAFPALRRLELGGLERVALEQFDELAPAMPALEELVLYQHQLPMVAASRLAARVRTLTLRSLGGMTLTLRSLPAIVAFGELRRVRLVGFRPLEPATIAALAAFRVPIEIVPNVPDVVDGDLAWS